MKTYISKNFTLQVLTATNVNLTNEPNEKQIANLKALVNYVLQPLRDLYGHPIHISSAFRTEAVNRALGGPSESQHCCGEAADLDCADNARLFYLIRNNLPFDQLIWEGGNDFQPAWVHVSFKANRGEVFRKKHLGEIIIHEKM